MPYNIKAVQYVGQQGSDLHALTAALKANNTTAFKKNIKNNNDSSDDNILIEMLSGKHLKSTLLKD
jgi:hypothetical protein